MWPFVGLRAIEFGCPAPVPGGAHRVGYGWRRPRDVPSFQAMHTDPTAMTRRRFLGSVAALGAAGVAGVQPVYAIEQAPPVNRTGLDDRAYWLGILEGIAFPVLGNLSRRELRRVMPVEAADPAARARFTHLEAFGRVLSGVAPWLSAPGLESAEAARQAHFIALAQASIDAATDPASPDYMNFASGDQPLVDTAFMAQGILRAPQPLWLALDERVRRQVVAALKASRAIPTPRKNNWVLFAAMVEAALHTMGEPTLNERFEECVHRMLGWYKGDGAYGDGEFFHFDYYNSFVIHPMLLDSLAVLQGRDEAFVALRETERERARRFAEVLERLIAPDGTFPSMGRSTTYRCGAFHALAQAALLRALPDRLTPARVRTALTAVIRRSMGAPGTFDANGWLQIGFCGHQPTLAEGYISTGSLYLCSTALLPLGLPPADPFWRDPAAPWTSQRLWSGEALAADHATAS
jgi:hypothetical protein